jgi:hypothetical protein
MEMLPMVFIVVLEGNLSFLSSFSMTGRATAALLKLREILLCFLVIDLA